MVEITRADPTDKAWDRFVEHHPLATVAHLGAWGAVFAETYGHQCVYLAARDGEDIVGVLPLILIRSRLFGRRLVSMPFLDYGGVLAEPGSGAERALLEAALEVAREHGAHSLGLRQFHSLERPATPGHDRVTMLLELTTEEAVWRALPAARRNRVRKGERSGLHSEWGGAELLDEFYAVFAANMRDLGSPVHHRRFFALTLQELGGAARVLVVRDRAARPVGAAVCLFFRGTIFVPWVSSRREVFPLCPNFTLYWDVIRFGCANGYRILDFGRSFRNAGTYEFKRQWGATPWTLPWLFIDVVPTRAPAPDRDARRFAPLIASWKRLPLSLATRLGPWLRGQLPN